MTLLNQDSDAKFYRLTQYNFAYFTQTFQELSQGLNGIQTYKTYYYSQNHNDSTIMSLFKTGQPFKLFLVKKLQVRQIDLT